MYAEARRKDKKPTKQQTTAVPSEEHKEAEPHSTSSAATITPSQLQPPPAAAAAAAAVAAASSASSPSYLAAGYALPCPPDATRLGRSTWTFLHTMAAYYPHSANPTQQQHATQLLTSLTSLYPCDHCASHLSTYYRTHPPQQSVQGRQQLSTYLCRVHNDVRERQGKRLFDCSRVLERWGGHDWDDKHSDKECDEREYGDVEDEQKATR